LIEEFFDNLPCAAIWNISYMVEISETD